MLRQPAKSFEDLVVWQKAHAFVLQIYGLSREFPREETYGLSAQLRRAAVSVPANIAEGFKKHGRPDKARLMNVAEASLEEARYDLRLARGLGYMPRESPLTQDAMEIGKLLASYTRSLLTPNS